MNKKISLGIIVIFLSLYYGLKTFVPDFIYESLTTYIFNYQMILMLLGIYFIINKNKFGWFVFFIGLYNYLNELLGENFKKGLPIFTLIGGIIILVLGIKENKKIKDNKIKKNKKDIEVKEMK